MSSTDMMDGLRYAIMEMERKRNERPVEVRMHGDMIDILREERKPAPLLETFMGVKVVEDASVYGYKVVTAKEKELEEMAVRVGEAARAQGVTMEEFLNAFTFDGGVNNE